MKTKITIIIFTLFVSLLSPYSFSQQLSDVSPSLLISKMKNTYLKVKDNQGFVDLVNNKYIGTMDGDMNVNFEYTVYEGSFINHNEKEYLLQINAPFEIWISSHAENGGNTTMIIIFDSNYQQISKVSFFMRPSKIIDIVDINEDGILEVLIKGGYSQMGFAREWIDIFSADLDNSLLNVIVGHNSEYSMLEGNRITLIADYTVQNNGILFKSNLKYYKVTKKNKEETKRKYYKTENKKDFYKFENNKFTHIDDNNNVNWDEPGLEF